jgi:adenylate cyclase
MMAECSERLVQAGLPLWRVGVFVRTLHPEIIGWSFIWKPGEEVHVGTVDFNFRATPEFTFSPLAVVFRDERDESTRRGVSQHTGEPRRMQWASRRAREVRGW